jgi:hypothetical protein
MSVFEHCLRNVGVDLDVDMGERHTWKIKAHIGLERNKPTASGRATLAG